MLKFLLLLLCSVVAQVVCWKNMNNALKNRVIHVESLRYRGRWIDAHDSKWGKVTPCPERDVYFKPWTQFEVRDCGSWVCIESLRYRNHYWDNHHYRSLAITYSTYPQNKVWHQWRIECNDDTMQLCRFFNPRYNQYVDAHHSGWARTAGYGYWSNFRILAPKPSEYFKSIAVTTNESRLKVPKKITLTQGVTMTSSWTHSITVTASVEISAAFKAFSGTASSSISNTWSHTHGKTYQQGKAIHYEIEVPAFSVVKFTQLTGIYGPFRIGSDEVRITCKDLRTKKPCIGTPTQVTDASGNNKITLKVTA